MPQRKRVPLRAATVVGRPGGIARAKSLSAKRRREIAQRAAETRWEAYRKQNGGQ
jgi:hypothetical protein